jgi:hypothetical protein
MDESTWRELSLIALAGRSASRILNPDTGLWHTLTVSGEAGSEVLNIGAGESL